HPHRVEKVVTLATKYEWNTAIAARETAMLQPGKMEAKIPQFAAQLQQRHSPGNWKTVVTKTADMLNRMGEEPPLKPADFGRINAEVLLLLGDRDKMVTLDETVNVMKALPNAQLGVLPGAPHPLEGADANLVAFLVKRFLG
ncbi:MAG TPA: hypothetical protein VMR70_09680, partial [Flavisolibacter sp.]|nr:hypothetical protein [Flavisolibacter sp.]